MGIQVVDQASRDVGDLDKIAHVLSGEMVKVAAAWRTYPYKVSTAHHRSWIKAYLVDDIPETPGALAFHDVNGDVPYIKLGVNVTLDAGESIAAVLAHEAFEYLVDPFCQEWCFDPIHNRFQCRESADPVQAGSYTVDGVEVSNWVTPAYFDADARSGFDHLGQLSRPFSVGSGGYAIVAKAGAESQVFGDEPPGAALLAGKDASQGRTFWRKIQAALLLGAAV